MGMSSARSWSRLCDNAQVNKKSERPSCKRLVDRSTGRTVRAGTRSVGADTEFEAQPPQSGDHRELEMEVLPSGTSGGIIFTKQDLKALLDRAPIQRPLAEELPPETY